MPSPPFDWIVPSSTTTDDAPDACTPSLLLFSTIPPF
jgi:hypothetical protein